MSAAPIPPGKCLT